MTRRYLHVAASIRGDSNDLKEITFGWVAGNGFVLSRGATAQTIEVHCGSAVGQLFVRVSREHCTDARVVRQLDQFCFAEQATAFLDRKAGREVDHPQHANNFVLLPLRRRIRDLQQFLPNVAIRFTLGQPAIEPFVIVKVV